ncbi:MAG: beta-N-acetylhexosaminidase [Spirochaetales bacterium]|nr:beta-N-acetylhexosaminidase [Spirochaetales bacterium]
MGLPIHDISLIPVPAKLKVKPGTFRLTPETGLYIHPHTDEIRRIGLLLSKHLESLTGYTIGIDGKKPDDSGQPSISILLENSRTPSKESYNLLVAPPSIILRSSSPQGLFRGVQTLRQLFPPGNVSGTSGGEKTDWCIPCITVSDYPAFKWRGLLLDCCRHFMTKDFIKHLLDVLAYYKLNKFHWHLTEDQGWRIEIKKYPRLTETGAFRIENGIKTGGYYTQDDVKEIVAYAAERYIEVIPEIEMPGHCTAALAAYPAYSCTGGPFEVAATWGIFEDVFCAGNDETFTFLTDILSEVADLFPSPYIHIGADEVPKRRWKDCGKCRQLMKEKGFVREEQLQSYFIARIVRFLSSLDKKVIGWDEVLEGDPVDGITVQYWRSWKEEETLQQAVDLNRNIIVSPTGNCYLDYPLDKIDLDTVYSLNPLPCGFMRKKKHLVLGGECNMWTEYAPQESIEQKLFPRLLALAEVLWSAPKRRETDRFYKRVRTHYPRLREMGIDYGKAFENEKQG